MRRYARGASSKKRGCRWEDIRLNWLAKDRIGKIAMGEVTALHLANWRDRRFAAVAPRSVRREMNLMSSVLSQAQKVAYDRVQPYGRVSFATATAQT